MLTAIKKYYDSECDVLSISFNNLLSKNNCLLKLHVSMHFPLIRKLYIISLINFNQYLLLVILATLLFNIHNIFLNKQILFCILFSFFIVLSIQNNIFITMHKKGSKNVFSYNHAIKLIYALQFYCMLL